MPHIVTLDSLGYSFQNIGEYPAATTRSFARDPATRQLVLRREARDVQDSADGQFALHVTTTQMFGGGFCCRGTSPELPATYTALNGAQSSILGESRSMAAAR